MSHDSFSHHVLFMTVALFCATGQGQCQPASSQDPSEPDLAAVVSSPESFLDQEVTLSGRLENEGKNFFTDLRVVLIDDENHQIHVRPWLPLSLPPRPSGQKGERPKVLSDYLGKTVEMTATVRRGELKRLGTVFYLEVKNASVKE